MTVRNLSLALVLACLAAEPAGTAIPNPVELSDGTATTGSATCHAADGSLGSWERATGISSTTQPSVLDIETGTKEPPTAMLYCRDRDGRAGKIEAKPVSLVFPSGTVIQPIYRVTITRPSTDDQPPFEAALGPGGVITKAAFGQVIIFGKHSMLIVPDGWKIESHAAGILPKSPDAFTSTLDVGGCEVNRMDDEDAYPRYIGTAAADCSIKIDLNALQ
jgi:hypothetical protein